MRKGTVSFVISLSIAGTILALGQSQRPAPNLARARGSAESFARTVGLVGPLEVFKSVEFPGQEPMVDFLTAERRRIRVGIITGDVDSWHGGTPIISTGRDKTRRELEEVFRRITRQRGTDRYETIVFDVFSAGDARLDRSKPEGVAYVLLREKDTGTYPVIDVGNHVIVQLGLKSGQIQFYSETRGYLKGSVPTQRISADQAKKIAARRIPQIDSQTRVVDAKLGWVIPERPRKSKQPGKLEYEFAWDVRLSNGLMVRVRAADGVIIGDKSSESTYAGMLERRKKAGLKPAAR